MNDRNMISIDLPDEEMEKLIEAAKMNNMSVEEFVIFALENYIQVNHPEEWQKIVEERNAKGIKEEDLVPGTVYQEDGTDEDGNTYCVKFEYVGKLKNYNPTTTYNHPYVFYYLDEEQSDVGQYSKSFLTSLTKVE